MRNSPDSSPACWSCRLEWRPSDLLVGALVVLAVLAAVAVAASALAPGWRELAAVAVLAGGLWRARREAARPRGMFAWSGPGRAGEWRQGGASMTLDDIVVDVRGPLLRVQGRDAFGGIHHLVWWPDTLGRGDRRALRLLSGVSARSDIPLPAMAA